MKDNYFFDVKRKRPEEIYENIIDYYSGDMITKYATSKSMMKSQEEITIRALELLEIKKSSLILDLGCGPGFSSIYLKELGYNVVALDLIYDFLRFYEIKELNPICADMRFLPSRPNTFNAIISISALQWVYRELNNKEMRKQLIILTKSIENILKVKAKAIFQFYPKNDKIMKEIGRIFDNNTKFEGNFIIDNPNNPKKRKIFLFLQRS